MTDAVFTVIVCTRHRPRELGRCLDALARLEGTRPAEVLVVENGAGAPEVRALAEGAGARHVVEPVVGLSRARNTGARHARTEWVAFIDDDAVAEPGWLDGHARAIAADPGLSATTGRILSTDPGDPVEREHIAAGAWDLGAVGRRIDRTTPHWFELTNFGGAGVGPNMTFRRRLFEAGWGFRESLGPERGLPGEEHYAFYTLVRDGHAIRYVPDAIVRHPAPSGLARRRRAIVSGSVAYALMLAVERPRMAPALLRYAATGVRGRRRDWRGGSAERSYVARWYLAVSLAIGPVRYLRWLLAFRRAAFRRPPRVIGPLA